MQITQEAVQTINELIALRANFFAKLELLEKSIGVNEYGIDFDELETVIDEDFAGRTDDLNQEEIADFVNKLAIN